MDNEKYFFKETPAQKQQAVAQYGSSPWKCGEKWSDFIAKAESMTDAEHDAFALDYSYSHNKSMHMLSALWSAKKFWTEKTYGLLYAVSAPGRINVKAEREKEEDVTDKQSLYEGLIMTVNANTVVRKLVQQYDFKDVYSPKWLQRIVYAGNTCAAEVVRFFPLSPKQIGVETGMDFDVCKIYVKIPDIADNKKMLVKAMSFFGYTLGEEETAANVQPDVKWVIMTFVPDFQEYVTERVLKENCFLFHISPTRFKEKVLKRGLCPQSKNERFNYPPRVYMLQERRFVVPYGETVKLDDNTLLALAKALHAAKTPGNKLSDEYTIYKIDISKLRSGIQLSYDQDYYPLGVFTADNINPEALEVYYEFNINDV